MLYVIIVAVAVAVLAFFRAKSKLSELKRSLWNKASDIMEASKVICWLLVVLGLVVGVTSSNSVFSGGVDGRINLIWVVFLYAILPLLSLIFLIITLILALPPVRYIARYTWLESLLSAGEMHDVLKTVRGKPYRKAWFFFHVQACYTAYFVGCLITYVVMMLSTDARIGWCSNWLNSGQMFDFLKLVSWTWSSIPEWQPTLWLVERTQCVGLNSGPVNIGLWTRYVLAAMLFYVIIPRSIILLGAYIRLRWQRAQSE